MEPRRIEPNTNNYILQGQTPVPCADLFDWAKWYENSTNRIVSQTTINGYFISTVFLAIDHNWSGGPPVLFETMIWDNSGKEWKEFPRGRKYQTRGEELPQDRYCTYLEAASAHEDLVTRYRTKSHAWVDKLCEIIDAFGVKEAA